MLHGPNPSACRTELPAGSEDLNRARLAACSGLCRDVGYTPLGGFTSAPFRGLDGTTHCGTILSSRTGVTPMPARAAPDHDAR